MAGTQVPRDPSMSAEVRRFLDDLSRRQETANIFYNLNATQATALLDVFTSALKGLVPASGGVAGTYLEATGSFTEPQGAVVLQCLQTTYATNADITTVLPYDDTVPLIGEGTEILTKAITPSSAANKVLCGVTINGGVSTAPNSYSAALFRGSTCIQAQAVALDNALRQATIAFDILDSPSTTSATTYSVRVGPAAANTLRLNGTSGGRAFGGVAACTLTLQEIKG
jgi:hypothetical protein